MQSGGNLGLKIVCEKEFLFCVYSNCVNNTENVNKPFLQYQTHLGDPSVDPGDIRSRDTATKCSVTWIEI